MNERVAARALAQVSASCAQRRPPLQATGRQKQQQQQQRITKARSLVASGSPELLKQIYERARQTKVQRANDDDRRKRQELALLASPPARSTSLLNERAAILYANEIDTSSLVGSLDDVACVFVLALSTLSSSARSLACLRNAGLIVLVCVVVVVVVVACWSNN